MPKRSSSCCHDDACRPELDLSQGLTLRSIDGQPVDPGTSGGAGDDAALDAGAHGRTVFDVNGLCCQSEVALIDDAVDAIEGIADHHSHIAAGTLTIYHDGDPDRVQELTEALCQRGLRATPRAVATRREQSTDSPWSPQFWVIVAGTVIGAGAVSARYLFEQPTLSALLFALAIGVGGFYVFRQALQGVRRRQFNIPILVTIAVVGASLIGEWFEAATVTLLFAFAEWLEAQSMARARREIGALMRLAPPTAILDDDQGPREVPVDEVQAGHRLRIRPGAKIPVDAEVLDGRSEVDESTITGEPMPVTKHSGDPIYAGTVNGPGALIARATQPASQSTLAHIIDAIEDARQNQSPTEQFIDRFAGVYTPAVVAAAALVALIPPLFFGGLWGDWFYRALVFLVIACPCALVISTPIANVAGLARAAREGVLVKGGKFLEQLGKLKALAFDKTGTLTRGQPTVETIHPLVEDLDEDQLLLAAARLETASEHHIGQALVGAARHRFSPPDYLDRHRDARAEIGAGIEGHIDAQDLPLSSDEVALRVGRLAWLEELGLPIADAQRQRFHQMEQGGRTVVAVADDQRLLGFVALRDVLRDEASQALGDLSARGVAHRFVLTGDNRETARTIAAELGLDDAAVFADLTPTDKVQRLGDLRQSHRPIAMVGDGVNDAPALAGADVGIAMGAAGTDVALESADIALMSDDLRRLATAVDVGRKTTRIIYQNIAIALGLKAIFLVLAIMGVATLWMAIVADMGASLIVIFNAIRLLRRPSTSSPAEASRPHLQGRPAPAAE